MAGALGPRFQLTLLVASLAEQEDDLAAHRAGLGQAEGQHIDACLPAHLGGARAGRNQRIAKPRAIHMDPQTRRMRLRGVICNFSHAIGRTVLGEVCQRQDMRRRLMHEIMIDPRQSLVQLRRADLAIRPAQQLQLAATGKEFRRAAFVDGDMRAFMAKHGPGRRTETGQRQRIRRGAGCGQPIVKILRTKHIGQMRPQTPGDRVIAIARLQPGIRGEDGFQHFRMRRGGCVRGEIHQVCVSGVCHIRCWPPSLAIIWPVTLLADTR